MDVSGFARSLVVEFLFASDRLPRSWAFRGLQLAGYDVSPCELRKATVETADLTIAPHCFVNRRFRIEGRGAVLIGSYTMIGPEVMITTSTHYRQPNGRLQVEST